MEYEEELPKTAQNESIKLIKNTKNYNWEIRILSTDIDRITAINSEMIKRFGEQELI